MIARNNSVNGQIPVKDKLKRFNQMNRFNYIYLSAHWGQTYMSAFTHLGQT